MHWSHLGVLLSSLLLPPRGSSAGVFVIIVVRGHINNAISLRLISIVVGGSRLEGIVQGVFRAVLSECSLDESRGFIAV